MMGALAGRAVVAPTVFLVQLGRTLLCTLNQLFYLQSLSP